MEKQSLNGRYIDHLLQYLTLFPGRDKNRSTKPIIKRIVLYFWKTSKPEAVLKAICHWPIRYQYITLKTLSLVIMARNLKIAKIVDASYYFTQRCRVESFMTNVLWGNHYINSRFFIEYAKGFLLVYLNKIWKPFQRR